MSRENFIEYYTKWLRKPENKKYADTIDSITNEAEFGDYALSQAKLSGLDFNRQDVIDVMEASVVKMRKDAGINIGDLDQARELAQKEMGAAAGGYTYNAFSTTTVSPTTSTVSIYGTSGSNILQDYTKTYDTIMCCW